MSLIAWLLAFFMMENLITTYGTGLGFIQGQAKARTIRLEVLTILYLMLASLLSWAVHLVLVRIAGFEFLFIFFAVLITWFLPVLMRQWLQQWIHEAAEWENGKDYSYSTALVLIIVLAQYRLDLLSVIGASAGASLALVLTITLYRNIMHRLSFEQIPPRFKGLPLALIVLGLLGLVFAGVDAALAESRIFSLFNV